MLLCISVWGCRRGGGTNNNALPSLACPLLIFSQAPLCLKKILLTMVSGRRHAMPNAESQHCRKKALHMTARKLRWHTSGTTTIIPGLACCEAVGKVYMISCESDWILWFAGMAGVACISVLTWIHRQEAELQKQASTGVKDLDKDWVLMLSDN